MATIASPIVPPYVSFVVLNRKEFPITDTLLKLIAAAAIIGLSNRPMKG